MEIEVKIRVTRIEDFERKIKFANFVKKEKQRDTYFKVPKGELLRVRECDGDVAFLCHKKIKDKKNTLFDEVEVQMEDGEKTIDILKSLGYEELIVIEKMRKTYEHNGITMELNKVKGIGDFVDFEIISEDTKVKEKILRFIKELGYSKNDIEPRLYIELVQLQAHSKKHRKTK